MSKLVETDFGGPLPAPLQQTRRCFLGGLATGIAAGMAGPRLAVAGSKSAPTRISRGDVDWKAIAAEFAFADGITYFNSGSEGSLPRRLQSRFSAALARWSSSPSFAFFSDVTLDQAQKANRARLAAFVGTSGDNLVITDNTTMGLSMVLMGLPFSAQDEIVTTEHEHYALLSPLNVISRQLGIRVRKIPLPSPADSADALVESFRRSISPRTRALCLSHVNWTTGLRMPVREICALARSRGILTVVDGAHGLGMLDLDLPALGCDFYACSGHKWLNGPPASGLLYIRDAKANPWRLVPTISEGSLLIGQDYSITDALQMRGSTNGPGFLTLAETADFDDHIGKHVIERRILELAGEVKRRSVSRWGSICLFSPPTTASGQALGSGLSAFVPSSDPSAAYDAAFVNQVVDALCTKHRIWVRATMFPAPVGSPKPQINTIRVSTNIFNSQDEISRLFGAIDEVVASVRPAH
jgi:isopenicillin-N epimerase